MERSIMGMFCRDIIEVDDLYKELEKEKDDYECYDGGQGPFKNTELYKEKIGTIKELEQNILRTIKKIGRPTVFGG